MQVPQMFLMGVLSLGIQISKSTMANSVAPYIPWQNNHGWWEKNQVYKFMTILNLFWGKYNYFQVTFKISLSDKIAACQL